MRWRVLWAILLLVGPLSADDEVILKNGDRLTGKVTELSKGKLSIETAHSGTIKVDLAQVVSIKTDGKVKVRLDTGELFEGKLGVGQNGRLKVETLGAAQPVEVELGRVKSFNEPPVEWHGGVDLAARATDGNTHNKGFLLAAEGTRETEIDKFTLRAIFRYAETNSVITERNSYGLGKYDYRLTPEFYAYASTEFFSDKFKDLSLRTVLSAGLGYIFLKESWIDLWGEAGGTYVDNDFRDAKDESHMGARLSAHVRVGLPLGFDFVDDFTAYPNFEHGGDWQYHNEASLATALGKGWTFKAGMITDFDNQPAAGARRYDDIYFMGLGYRF